MPRILLETTFLKLAQNEPLTTIARLLQALGDIQRKGGLPPRGRSGPARGGNPSPPRGAGGTADSKEASPPAPEPPASNQDAWARIVREAGSAKPLLRKILGKATPIDLESGKVVIGFDGHSEFGSSLAGEQDSIKAIEAACEKVMGSRCRVIIERNSSEANAARSERISRKRKEENKLRESALVHPVVREAKDMFDAEIKDIKTDVE
jgi:hypothetical protein